MAQDAEGYRICANYDARVHQIDLITTAPGRTCPSSVWP